MSCGPHNFPANGSHPSILRYWDLRRPTRKSRAIKPKAPAAIYATETDPTTLNGSLRARGIASLALGCGPTDGLVFALGADSCIHTYEVPTLQPLTSHIYTHERLQPTSFYIRVAASPCGRWLACGSTASGVCLFDVSGAARVKAQEFDTSGVTLGGHIGEVSALDWAHERLSSGADDGSVRTWRPNVEVARECLARPEPARWDWSWADY
jgi:denticleless